jgi:hypothetical protein
MPKDNLIERLRELLERATRIHPGMEREDRGDGEERYIVFGRPCGLPVAKFGDGNDALLFISAREDLPKLLDELTRKQALIEEMVEGLNPFAFGEHGIEDVRRARALIIKAKGVKAATEPCAKVVNQIHG